MLINLRGSVHNDEIKFDLTPVYFSSNSHVRVTEMAIQWDGKAQNIHGKITTTLIDKSPVNPSQQLLFFYQSERSNFMFYTPTHPAEYKIQCPSLQSSVFNIHLSEKHQIREIYIQLEINARVQQITPKKI